jgi:hypothetical protein
MGLQQGQTLSAQLKAARTVVANAEETQLRRPFFLPMPLLIRLGSLASCVQYAPAIRKLYTEQYRRICGIARGAGVSVGFILLLQAFEVELNKPQVALRGCTAIGVRGPKSANGKPVIGKNFDYPVHFSDQYITRLDAPKNRYRVLSVSAAPLAGNHDGINEHGLVVCYNYGYGLDRPGAMVPISILVQETLETCRTTSEAVQFLSQARHCGGALLMVADAGGDMCTMELTQSHAARREPRDHVLINTNHYLDSGLQKLEIPHDVCYTRKAVKALLGIRMHESSEVRFARAAELTSKIGTLTTSDLEHIMRDHGTDGHSSDNTICRHSSYFATTCSMLFCPAERSLKVMYAPPCSGNYQEFTL